MDLVATTKRRLLGVEAGREGRVLNPARRARHPASAPAFLPASPPRPL